MNFDQNLKSSTIAIPEKIRPSDVSSGRISDSCSDCCASSRSAVLGAETIALAEEPRGGVLNFKSVLQSTTHFVGASYLARILCAVRSFINARILGPELYGFWGSLSFLVSFGFHFHGGVQDVMIKQIPTFRSEGREDLARKTAQVSFSFFSVMLTIAVAVIWFYAARLPAAVPAHVKWGWWIVGLVLPLEVLYFFEQTVTRCEERFRALNASLLLSSIASLILTCWLVVRYSIAGLYVMALVAPLIGLVYLRKRAVYPWRFVWQWNQIIGMLKIGWPILAMTLIFESLGWTDRFLVLAFVGTTGFGYYMLGFMALQVCFLFPQAMASIVEPKLFYDYARNQRVSDIREHLLFPLKTLSIILPMGLAFVDLLLPVVIKHMFPAYLPGVPAMRVLVWGSVFMGLLVSTKSFIVAIGKQKKVLLFYVLAVLVHLAVSTTLAFYGWGLVGIAMGTLVAYAVCATELLTFVFLKFGESMTAVLKRIGSLYFPSALVFGVTVVVPFGLTKIFQGFSASAVMAVEGVGIILCCGVFYFSLRRYFRDYLSWNLDKMCVLPPVIENVPPVETLI